MDEIQVRLHRRYGVGLHRLQSKLLGAENTDSVSADTDPSYSNGNRPTTNKDGTQTFNGVTFDPHEPETFALGTVAGAQFDNNTYGKCFYAMVDTMNFVDYITRDVARIMTTYNWYTPLVYDPIHFYGNIMASYQ